MKMKWVSMLVLVALGLVLGGCQKDNGNGDGNGGGGTPYYPDIDDLGDEERKLPDWFQETLDKAKKEERSRYE